MPKGSNSGIYLQGRYEVQLLDRLTYAEIEPLLVKNTCTACHQVSKRQVGPSFAGIAKRKYSNERIVELIYKPEPKNWPEHETPMAAIPQVPRNDALQIAMWINFVESACTLMKS